MSSRNGGGKASNKGGKSGSSKRNHNRGRGGRAKENSYLFPICELLIEGDGKDQAESEVPEVTSAPQSPGEPSNESEAVHEEESSIIGVFGFDDDMGPAAEKPKVEKPKADREPKKKKGRKGRLQNLAQAFQEEAQREGERCSIAMEERNAERARSTPMAIRGRDKANRSPEHMEEQLSLEVENMEEQLALCMSAGSFDAIKDELQAFLNENAESESSVSGSGSTAAASPVASKVLHHMADDCSSSPAVVDKLGFEREYLLDGPTDNEYYACEAFLDATDKVAAHAAQRRADIEQLRQADARSDGDAEGAMSRSMCATRGLAPLLSRSGSSNEEGHDKEMGDAGVALMGGSLPQHGPSSMQVTPDELRKRLRRLKEERADEASFNLVEHENTKVRLEVECVEVNFEVLPAVFVELIEALHVGMGFKGGVARKVLKLMNGVTTEMSGIDVDVVLTVDRRPKESSDHLKVSSACKEAALHRIPTIGEYVLCPEDIEVLSVGDLHAYYWRTRDVTMNECLVLRSEPDTVLLLHTTAAREDAVRGIIRCMPHCLMSDYCFIWRCDYEGNPILTSNVFERCLVRYLKGQGTEYDIDKHTWAFYRRTKLSPTSVFRIMKNFSESTECMDKAVKHLEEKELVGSHHEANLLWNHKAQEIKRASSGAIDLQRKMSVADCERWAKKKKAQMKQLREQLKSRAGEVGFVESDREAAVRIPARLRAFASPTFVVRGGAGAPHVEWQETSAAEQKGKGAAQ